MGLLNIFSSKAAPSLLKLPSGSFTVDRRGQILASTISCNFPAELIHEIGRAVLSTFQEAVTSQLPLTELVIRYPNLKITARELRGGAIVFLAPQLPYPGSKPS